MTKSPLIYYLKGEIMSYRPDLDQTLLRTDGGGWFRLPGYVGVNGLHIEVTVRIRRGV